MNLEGDEHVVTRAATAETINETPQQFEVRVSIAQGQGVESLETTPEIIKHFNPRGLGTQEYFIYKNVKVFPYGKTDEILDHENEQLGKRLHGTSEGTLDNR